MKIAASVETTSAIATAPAVLSSVPQISGQALKYSSGWPGRAVPVCIARNCVDGVAAVAEPAEAVGFERRPAVDQHRHQHRRDQRQRAGGQRAERELHAPVAGGLLQVGGKLRGVALARLHRVGRRGRRDGGGICLSAHSRPPAPLASASR